MSASGLVIMSCSPNAQANILPLPSLPDAITSVYNTHFTYTSHPKETLLSSVFYPLPENPELSILPLPKALGREEKGDNKNIQLASVCFVTDTNDCSGNRFANADGEDNGHGAPGGGDSGNDADNGNQDDYDLDNAERCKKEGYNKTSCLPGEVSANTCPYDSTYFEDCTCPSGYTTCTPPYYGVGTACGNKYASCGKDTERACQELNPGYVDECGTGQQLSSDRCSYDSSYGTCCNTCAGYDYTSIPDGYVQNGEACVDCNGQPKYKIKPNPCDGFLDCGSMGPDTGATTCLSGTTTKYDNCKPCQNKGTLTNCPSPYTCTYEECSGRYYKSGCKSGYDWNSSNQTCTAQCSSSYKYTCSGTGYAGGSGTACGGKYKSCKCSSGYFWGGSGCVKGNDCMKGSEIGYILYSDMTRSKNLISGKTPIGVVVCSYADGGGQAMALKSIGRYTWTTLVHGLSDIKIPYAGTGVDNASCKNTAAIMAAGDKNAYPAAWAAYEYKTTGTKVGDWCLPANSALISIANNMNAINIGFDLVGGSQISSGIFSSSKLDQYYVLALDFEHAYAGSDIFYWFPPDMGQYQVRPVIGFCKDGYEYDKNTDSCKVRSCKGYSQTLQSECVAYETCQSGNTKYYRCTACNPCSTLCGDECVKGYDNISKIGPYKTYTTCEYSGKTYYAATSCNGGYMEGIYFDSSRGYCYKGGGDNLPCGL